ncbi:MAG: PAS domain-containing sensor histidine kinase [Gammaproteobacteria bacterium]|nr:PAS domain-containing sensor histidine kinase [Gammaproteobacteria bacterium]
MISKRNKTACRNAWKNIIKRFKQLNYSLNLKKSHNPNPPLPEKSVQEIIGFYENIIGCMPGNVYWLDRNCTLLGGNDNLANMFGVTRKKLAGLTYKQMAKLAHWTEGQGEVFRQAELRVMETGQPHYNKDEPPVMIEGKVRYYISSKVPIYGTKGEIIGVVGISTDITERKEAEEKARQAIQQATEEHALAIAEKEMKNAITVLAGSIAHDLRIPLTSLNLVTDLYTKSQSALLAEYKQLLSHVENREESLLHLEKIDEFPIKLKNIVREMNEFINTTLESMKRLVTGTLSYDDFVVCEIEQSLLSVLGKYPFQGQEKNLINMDNIHNFSFLGCPVLFYRILFNLIANSLQQINKNQIGKIFISTELGRKFNILRIRDTAGGAPQHIIEHLFDGYVTTKKKGTGVGLAFCKLTMKSFGGNITCHSVEGDYIEFVLKFPQLPTSA